MTGRKLVGINQPKPNLHRVHFHKHLTTLDIQNKSNTEFKAFTWFLVTQLLQNI